MRRTFFVLVATLLVPACVDENLTLNEACLEDAECLGSQFCGRTPQEVSLGLAGVCLEEGDQCLFGNQLGCACDAGTLPDNSDDSCIPMPPRYQVNQAIFVTCDKESGSPTFGTCVQDFGGDGETGN